VAPYITISRLIKIKYKVDTLVMGISEKLKKDGKPVWDRIDSHPFIVELCEGTLDREKFKFYVLQDYHYLVSAIKNFSIITSRADTFEDIIETVEIGHLVSISEYKSYLKLLKKLGLTIKDASETRPIPVVLSYTSFLFSISSQKSFPEAMVSILPCFWSYGEAIKYNKEGLKKNNDDIYLEWTSIYFSKDYVQLLERIKKLIDKAAIGFPYEKLKDIFLKSSRYEYMYWDDMYNLKNWPV
jgi:thiaminase (transcriptional activator TenA)